MNKMGDFTSETISNIDREFVEDLLRKGERIDGRAFNEYRKIEIEANVVPAKAEGSALVRLGDTSVVAGVKVLVGERYPDSPDEGVTMVTAEMSPIASPLFELLHDHSPIASRTQNSARRRHYWSARHRSR